MAFPNVCPDIQRSVVDASVATHEDAQVIILLARHATSNISLEQEKEVAFNCTVIRQHYKEGDSIWVEESEELPPNALKKNQIPLLHIPKANIGGWDDPESCRQAEALSKRILTLSMTSAHREKQDFVATTWAKRQNYLFTKIDKYVLENRGKLYILTGDLHGDREFCQKLKERKIRFTMLRYASPPPMVPKKEVKLEFFKDLVSKLLSM